MQKPRKYHHSNIPKPLEKPKPTIQKITFTKEEQEGINDMLEGNVNKYTKGHYPLSSEYKMKLLKNYYGGYCHGCQAWPCYKLVFDMNGAQLKEFYCEKCMPKEYS